MFVWVGMGVVVWGGYVCIETITKTTRERR